MYYCITEKRYYIPIIQLDPYLAHLFFKFNEKNYINITVGMIFDR